MGQASKMNVQVKEGKKKKEVEDPLDDLINFFNQILEDYDIDELIRSKNNLKN